MGENMKGKSPEELRRLEKLKALQMVLSLLLAHFQIALSSVQPLTESFYRPTLAHLVGR
jgi:hypothetical protein